MAGFNETISRGNAQALMPEEVADAIITRTTQESAALRLFPHVPLSRAQARIPVIATLPAAYWVQGDTGLRQTSHVEWGNKYLNVEELAVIVPVPKNVVDDAAYDMWAAIEPLCAEAIGRELDSAVFLGVNKPASWPLDVVHAAAAAGNVVARGTSAAGAGGIAEDVNLTMGTVEVDGYDVNGFAAPRAYRARLRGARDTLGQRLLDVAADAETLMGQPIAYSMRGLWGTPAAASGDPELVAGDFSQGILGIRKDIEYDFLDQAVIQDSSGNIVYNLAQQKMVALMLTARFAFQVPNPPSYDQPVEAQRYPFAVITKP